jgi:hypothetical protein
LIFSANWNAQNRYGRRLESLEPAHRAKGLHGKNHPAPRVINTDKYAAYPPAIAGSKPKAIWPTIANTDRSMPDAWDREKLELG